MSVYQENILGFARFSKSFEALTAGTTTLIAGQIGRVIVVESIVCGWAATAIGAIYIESFGGTTSPLTIGNRLTVTADNVLDGSTVVATNLKFICPSGYGIRAVVAANASAGIYLDGRYISSSKNLGDSSST
jgi:hypothetical protein